MAGLVSGTRADDWEHALITGNGRQGALVHGGPHQLRLTLAHEKGFRPRHEPLDPPHTAAILPELRAALLAGRHQEAADRVVAFAAGEHPGYAALRWIDPLAGVGTMAFAPRAPRPWLRRGVDFRTGVAWQECAGLRSETFVSRVRDVVVWRLAAAPGTLDGVLRFDPIPSTAWYSVSARFVAIGGTVRPVGEEVRVEGATTLLVLAATGVGGPPTADLTGDWGALLAEHAAAHGELYDRCALDLGGDPHATSEELLAAGGPALIERLFAAGRYAIISATGELPPTLQGVWSGTADPPWSSGYTLDGNLQAAVAGLLPTGSPELLLPVFDLLDGLLPDFRANARRLYGCGGILVPPHLSTHGRHNHFGPVWCLTFWTAGAAWLSRLYHDYWRYTGDREFLAGRAWRFLTEAAEFYVDFAVTGPGGATFVPSYSPENAPANTGSQAAVNATMDSAAVGDLLRNLLDAAAVLGRRDPREPRWRALLAALPPYRVNDEGELAEWAWPGLADNHAHRHASHLYPLWYENLLDPSLHGAATRAIDARLNWWRGNEADEMAFGLVQLGLAAAQLGLADRAHEALTMLTRYWRPSLVSTHNRGALFNVDICGGLPALVAAMLLRSGRRRVDLLPALPHQWPSGEVRGLRARDGIRVERLAWTPAAIEAVVSGPAAFTVGFPDGTAVDVDATAGPVTLVR